MSLTIDQDGKALTETQDGITMPADYSFATVNDYVHGIDRTYEELECLCLGMASYIDKATNKRDSLLSDIERCYKMLLSEPDTKGALFKAENILREAIASVKGDQLTVENCPIGTIAQSIGGGRWYRTDSGWKWNGPDGTGSTFPRPGGDWNGTLIPPAARSIE